MSTPIVPRIQTRHTSTPGDPVQDKDWAVDKDTGPIPFPTPSPQPGVIKAVTVTASGNDGNLPGNVIDGLTTSRWACQGIGSWIEVDLGNNYSINKLGIDWFMQPADAGARTYDVSITFTDTTMGGVPAVVPFSSTGIHSDIPVTNMTARTIRLTLNKTSNKKGWFAINEITVYGSSIVPVPPGPTPTCPANEVWDPISLKCVPIVTPPTSNVDIFGIPKIYDDLAQPCNNWAFSGDLNDPRFMEQKFTDAGNGWLHFSNPTEGRVEILSDPAANENTIPTFDVNKVLAKGYLYKPVNSPDGKGDFGPIEITWKYKVIKAGTGTTNGESHLEIVPGGYRQTSSLTAMCGADKAVPQACEAMSIHGNVYPLSGRTKFEKDSQHTNGYTKTDPEKTNAVAKFDNGQEVIQKMVLYTLPNSDPKVVGGKSVKVETYFDETGTGTGLKKILEFLDSGQWGPTRGGNSACHCSENVVLSMARVAIGFRCDNMVEFVCKDMSVRSIDSSKPLHAAHAEKAPHEAMVEEDVARLDKVVSKDEVVQAKKEADTIATHATDPKDRKDASKLSQKLDDIVQVDDQSTDEKIDKKVDDKLKSKNIKITGKLEEE